MRNLGAAVAAFALAAAAVGAHKGGSDILLLAAASFLCAYAAWRSAEGSSFLKIFIAVFSTETIVLGAIRLLQTEGLWPDALAEFAPPKSTALAVAVFSILTALVARFPVVRQMTAIADLYFDQRDIGEARLWPLPNWRARESRIAIAFIVALVVINQAQVGINVRLSFFSRDWFNAIQEKDSAAFWRQLFEVFLPWAVVYITSAVIEFVLQSVLQMRWRRWLTGYFTNRWLGGHAHYRMQLRGGGADNPDQRIAEDVNHFIGWTESGLEVRGIYSYTIILISTLSTLVSFSIVLWDLSVNFTFPGTNVALPGFLLWIAILYAAIGTGVTHWVGRILSPLNFEKQHREADFRFQLARSREYSEQIALLDGEATERSSLYARFAAVVSNYFDLMHARKRLTILINGYKQVSGIIPYVLTAPFYFAGKVTLGAMTQTAEAFGTVNESMNFFINYYGSLASFKSVLDRLTSFDQAIDAANALQGAAPHIAEQAGRSLDIEGLTLGLPSGRAIVSIDRLALEPGQSTLLTGPSGSGKSTLFRALAGIWPYGSGAIRVPRGAKLMLLPQRPYVPMGTLAGAIAYPAAPGTFSREAMAEAMRAARLEAFVERLDEDDNWGQRLSGGEQQRVAVARALLARPDWLFLDEATSALDEKLEAEIYAMLAERLPGATIVSIGHRSTLEAFHRRHLAMQPGADGLARPVDHAGERA